MVGHISSQALTAVGYATQFFFLVQSVLLAIGFACVALMARAIGAGDVERARRALLASIEIATVTAVALVVAILTAPHTLLELLGATPAIVDATVPYLTLVLGSSVFLSVSMTLESGLRANRNTRTPMLIAAIVAAVKVALNALLIFGSARPASPGAGRGRDRNLRRSAGGDAALHHLDSARRTWIGAGAALARYRSGAFRATRRGAPIAAGRGRASRDEPRATRLLSRVERVRADRHRRVYGRVSNSIVRVDARHRLWRRGGHSGRTSAGHGAASARDARGLALGAPGLHHCSPFSVRCVLWGAPSLHGCSRTMRRWWLPSTRSYCAHPSLSLSCSLTSLWAARIAAQATHSRHSWRRS